MQFIHLALVNIKNASEEEIMKNPSQEKLRKQVTIFTRKLWQIGTFAGTYPHCRRPTQDQGRTTCTLAVHQWAAPVVPRSSKCSSRRHFHQSTATARYQNAASPTSSTTGKQGLQERVHIILNKWELRSEKHSHR